MRINVIKSNKNLNWGDAFGPLLVEKMTGVPVVCYIGKHKPKSGKAYLVCGSNLVRANRGIEVWGAGFLKSDSKTDGVPDKVHCVRGYLTSNLLARLGIRHNRRYGDPGLLCAKYWPPSSTTKMHVLGVIPHYRSRQDAGIDQLLARPGVLYIDVCSGIQEVIDAVAACQFIASSSLHGLVIADALEVPALWIESYPRWEPHWFKFIDYFSTVGRTYETPLKISGQSVAEVCERACECSAFIDTTKPIEDLLASFPFKKDKR